MDTRFFLIAIQAVQTTDNQQVALILYVTGVVVVFFIMVLIFFMTFQKRKTKLLEENFVQQQLFDKELQQTQQDIQEQTLNDISRELHDNVGQLLAFASMQLNTIKVKDDAGVTLKVTNAASAVKDSLTEIRALSRSLNGDVIFNLGFDTTVNNEIKRLNNSGLIAVDYSIEGKPVPFINKKHQIILFRIFQEFSSNTLKYAEATILKINLHYAPSVLTLVFKDNGKGFEINKAAHGAGIINMKQRAKEIGATFQLESRLNLGTTLVLSYPFSNASHKYL